MSPPKAEGFGSRLISRVLATDFEGDVSIDYHPEGVRVVLTGILQHPDNAPKLPKM